MTLLLNEESVTSIGSDSTFNEVHVFALPGSTPSSANTTLSYINTSGVLVSSSDETLKYSLRKKDPISSKDYVGRFLQLDIFSYCYHWGDEKMKDKHNSNILNIGGMYKQISELFPICVEPGKLRDGYVCPYGKDCKSCNKTGKHINDRALMFYLILAFKQHVLETRNIQSGLQKSQNDLISGVTTDDIDKKIAEFKKTISAQANMLSQQNATILMLSSQLSTIQNQYNNLNDSITQMQSQITSLTKIVKK